MRFKKIFSIVTLLAVSVILTGGILTTAQTEEDVDLQKGLVAYWSFDEGEGDIVFDESGNHNDGMLMCTGKECSAPKWVEGKKGYALKFDGVDDYVKLNSWSQLEFGKSNFTISTWILQKSVFHKNGTNAIIGTYPHSPVQGIWRFSLEDGKRGDKIQFQIKGDKHIVAVSANKDLVMNKWSYLVGLRKGDTLKLFINGTLESSVKGVDQLTISYQSGNYPTFGNQHGGGYFHGIIDSTRIYKRALTKVEIKTLFQQVKNH